MNSSYPSCRPRNQVTPFCTCFFLTYPISTEMLKEILHVASRAPSGTNTQPWKVYVVRGQTRDLLVERVCTAQNELFVNPGFVSAIHKKLLPIIHSSGFRHLLSVAVKMAGACMAYSTSKKAKKKKWRRLTCVTINCSMRLSGYFLRHMNL